MQYKLIIHDKNYGTDQSRVLLSETYDQEPTHEEVVDLVLEECGQVAVLQIKQGDDFQTRYIMTIK